MAKDPRGTILLLEDDVGIARLMRLRLERLGYTVVSATTPADALSSAERGDVDLLLLDYRLSGEVSGLDVHRDLLAAGQDIPAILVTGFSDEGRLIEAIRAGVRDFVPKTPDFLDFLPTAIERVMGQVRTRREAAESRAMRRTNEQLQRLIAERQRLEEELRASNQQLVEADRRKDEFLAMLAHELRSPLAAITNGIGLLRRGNITEHREWCQEVIDRQAKHLGRLVDDLLDVSRITRGKIELQCELIDLHELVLRAVDSVRPMIEERSQVLSVGPAQGPLRLHVDPTRLEQVLVNLLNNASKYTDRGGHIALTTRQHGGELIIAVKDSGVGIEPEMLSRVFDPFTQVDQSLARSQGGLGIGLTLVKRLVELHGGSIEAKSEGLGSGSEFVVQLPILDDCASGGGDRSDEPMTAEPCPASERRTRVLVVDDDRDTAQAMAKFLAITGFETLAVHDGMTALNTVQIFRPDVVLLDIGLPGMDGYHVARSIRDSRDSREISLIAVSGYAGEADRASSNEAGFDHHLAKPVDLDAILRLLTSRGRTPAMRVSAAGGRS